MGYTGRLGVCGAEKKGKGEAYAKEGTGESVEPEGLQKGEPACAAGG